MTQDDKILNKVRALLAQAEDAGVTEAEAEAFTAKAAELMARYGIDEAMAAQREERREVPDKIVVDIEAPYAGPKATLLNQVALGFRCKLIQMPTGSRSTVRAYVYGFQSDLDMVQMLYTSLLLQMANGLLRIERQTDWAGRSRTRSARSSYIVGFAVAIKNRLVAANRTAETDTASEPGTALVLRSRELAVQDAFTAAHPSVRNIRRTVSNSSGYSRGYSDGQRANLHNRPAAGGSSRRAIR